MFQAAPAAQFGLNCWSLPKLELPSVHAFIADAGSAQTIRPFLPLVSPMADTTLETDAYATIQVGLAELQNKVSCCGQAGKYLYEQMVTFNRSEYASLASGESWSLGDSPAVAVTINPGCGEYKDIQSKRVNPDTSYTDNGKGRLIRVYETIDSRYVLEDFFSKLELNYKLV